MKVEINNIDKEKNEMYNKNPIMNMAMNIVQHYNHKSYWRMRDYVVNSGGGYEF